MINPHLQDTYLSWPNLDGAELRRAVLGGAELVQATLSAKQLARTASLERWNMPDDRWFEEWVEFSDGPSLTTTTRTKLGSQFYH